MIRGQKENMREAQGMLQLSLKPRTENAATGRMWEVLEDEWGQDTNLPKIAVLKYRMIRWRRSREGRGAVIQVVLIFLSASNFSIRLKNWNKMSRGFFDLGIQAVKQNLFLSLSDLFAVSLLSPILIFYWLQQRWSIARSVSGPCQ